MGLSATEPESSLLVHVAHVPHAVPKAAFGIGDLRQRGGVIPPVVCATHLASLHGELPHLSGGQLQIVGPGRDRLVVDSDDPHVHTLHRKAHADTSAQLRLGGGLREDGPAPYGADRQRLGRAVRRMNFGALGEHAAEEFQHRGLCRGPCRDHSAESRQLYVVRGAVASHAVQKRR